jgi:predicted nucleic acid-binding protein
MWIVIDTNIFYKDLRLTRSLDLLFRDIENLPYSIQIPEVIVQETINKYKEQRQTYISRLFSSLDSLKKFTSFDINIEIGDEDLETDIDQYEIFLRERIDAFGKILPLPKTSTQELIDRALSRRKPFNSKGEGFRDVLIWETIIELVQKDDCEGIALITDNTTDFSNGDGLHKHLIDDLSDLDIDANKVILFTSLENFIISQVLPALDELNDIKDGLKAGNLESINLENISEQFLWDLISGYEIDPNCLPKYSEENSDIFLSGGTSDYEIIFENLSVKRLSRDELLISIDYELECEIDLVAPKWDVFTYEFSELGFCVIDLDWNNHYSMAVIELPFRITVRFVFNESQKKITSADIIGAECLRNSE